MYGGGQNCGKKNHLEALCQDVWIKKEGWEGGVHWTPLIQDRNI
jgi:hypothetical protein